MTNDKETCVLSSRVELIRNLKAYPFPSLLSEDLLDKLLYELRYIFDSQKIKSDYELMWSSGRDLGYAHQMQLQLKHGFQHKKYQETFYQIAEDPQKNLILFFGAGDHIQIKKTKLGLSLDSLWEEVNHLDDLIDGTSEYAFDPDLGYLTSHVTDVGTGMHASVLMHLPALKESGLIDDINQAAGQLGLTVTGLSDQVSRGSGAFYRIQNHVTIGRSEWEIIDTVTEISRQIALKENDALDNHYLSNRLEVEDKVGRAMGILSSAKLMEIGEFLEYVSSVRMGVRLKLIQDKVLTDIDALIFETSAGALQIASGKTLSAVEIKSRRADACRRFFK